MVTAGAIGVGIALTVATGGLGAPVAMAIGGAASGAIMSGYDAYSSGQRGWGLVGSIAKGAGLGAITGFVGGQFIGAGANVAANVTQNIANQTVRHVAKAGVEAGVETVIDTGISVATGNPITLKNVVTDYGLNLITNGSGSVSSKKSAKADVPTNKPKFGNSTSSSPKTKTDYSQNRKYWKNEVEFNGNKVYQRDDLIDPNVVSSWKENGVTVTGTNVERMASGRAPIGPDGKSIELHHTTQRQTSSIAETTYTFHKQNSKTIHINPNRISSGINRNEFGKWRGSYWENRAKDFID
ncbi:HNH/ENDO VII family nuclease [Streptococcus suis]